MDKRGKQKIVALGAISGVLAMGITVFLLTNYVQIAPTGLHGAFDNIVYTLRLLPFAVLPLLIGIIFVGNNRFLSDAIDPLEHAEDRTIEINGRVVENTLQQTVVFCFALIALSTFLRADQMNVIPALVVVFIIARTVFWIGYRIHPLYRAPGMSATGYMNVGIVVYTIFRAIAGF